MVTTNTTKLMTAEELIARPNDGGRYELVAGVPRRMPVGGLEHSVLGVRFARVVGDHVDRHALGVVAGADALIRVERDPDEALVPDMTFFRAERLPPRATWRGVTETVPDLVIEVVSRNDTGPEMTEKVAYYLAHGVPLVWVSYPRRPQIAVHRTGRDARILNASDHLDGEEVLPGFRVPVRELFL